MYCISSDKINGFFKAVAAKYDLFVPADTVEGKADFKKWSEDVKLSAQLKTVRSAKDFFFFFLRSTSGDLPKCQGFCIVSLSNLCF